MSEVNDEIDIDGSVVESDEEEERAAFYEHDEPPVVPLEPDVQVIRPPPFAQRKSPRLNPEMLSLNLEKTTSRSSSPEAKTISNQ